MNIDLDTLLLLDTIERRGSFAAAADALHRVPSALTHALRRAEAALGFPLYVREGRRAVLTAAGRSLLDGGRPLLDAAAGLERRARQVAKGWESELRIAVDALIPIERLFPLVAQFHADGHETELRLSAEVLAGCWDALLSGRADLAIGAPGDTPPGGGLATRPMGAIDFIFAIAPHHPLAASPEPLAAAEIRRHRAVVLADTTRGLAARSVGLISGQATMAVPTAEAKVAAQVAGLGVGHLPLHLAQPEIDAGRLVPRRTAEPRSPVALHLAWRSEHRGKALDWFLTRLLGSAEAPGQLAQLLPLA